MSLPITNVVDVSVLISPKAKELQSFGKLLFVTNEQPKVPALNKVLSYKSLPGVAEEWETTSHVYKAATAFYGAGAKDFMVTIAPATETAAVLTGGAATLAEIQAVTAGGFTINVNGAAQVVTGLNFGTAASMTAVANLLKTKLTGVNVTVGPSGLVLTTVMKGTGASISFATADVGGAANALGLLKSRGATIKAAEVPITPVAALNEAADIDPSFYGIVLHSVWRDVDETIEVAEFAQASRRVFFNTTNDADTLVKGNATSIAARIKAKSLQRTLSHYSSYVAEYPSAAVAGRAFLVNFEGTNTTITLNLKVIAGVTVEKLRQSQLDALKEVNCNAVVDIAGTYVYSDSRMGDGTWFDAVHGVDWLQNRIETGIFNRLYTTTTKIPYTDTGVTIILAEIEQALIQGRTNGLIAPGNNTAGEYLPLGYKIEYIPTAQVSQADKSNRVYKGITFEAVGAGAMHQVVVSGTFNE